MDADPRRSGRGEMRFQENFPGVKNSMATCAAAFRALVTASDRSRSLLGDPNLVEIPAPPVWPVVEAIVWHPKYGLGG